MRRIVLFRYTGKRYEMKGSHPSMQNELFDDYLGILGVERRMPGLDALIKLVRAHLARVPFENVSKLYYKKHLGLRGLPSLELFLNGIDRFNFGGTCYANNYYFNLLLADLGYLVKLCGADMSQPDVHVVSLVTVEGREYLVDLGYAAPFSSPMPRDLAVDYIIALGRDRYVLEPQDGQGYSRLKMYRDGEVRHGYIVKPMPRQIRDFEAVIADSYREEATFMNALLLARAFPEGFLTIHNLEVIESQGAAFSMRTLDCQDELVQVIFDRFGIPAQITRDVLSELGRLDDVWS
jgi:N-hydroxyarylamine O-acetyltransferase